MRRSSHISAVDIQWWGISFAKQYSILAAGEDGVFHSVKSQDDARVNPTDHEQDYNEWSKLDGWEMVTRRIKFEFKDGHLDPWGMNVMIGLRQINVTGRWAF